ncbi:hypothetical protein SPRG_12665 [Saprolegnia parasitica CBS 223.65]|uniref:FYVE-type domain-containing protein n=1 Tax=Saprolegnia parasitica (strain CBS 223.65) TaxID=695850 RepID=A0A067C5X2_SAPPC|nr:hypothetical protein SPRG_12665 [Saprolegnia parasitica CBS 223.65]KDO22167.1 hypothetical protein SPRG_12665 [Saprolegnia parasitica CBS 223.65]|eukprot:XP_012207107.1 hypothetical protein SPRG_12665 [Saprolegnia parasitica CBS 223.65]
MDTTATKEPTRSNYVLPLEYVMHPAKWVDDEQRDSCRVCSRNFNLLRRKHHCRVCGDLACSNCLVREAVEMTLPGTNDVKVCLLCIIVLDETAPCPSSRSDASSCSSLSSSSTSTSMTSRSHSASCDVLLVDRLASPLEWVPNHSRQFCLLCKASFNPFRRKHHCRVCGELVCSQCLIRMPVALPRQITGKTTTKACVTCVMDHVERTPVGRSAPRFY